jgi:hypothetical protein
MSKEEEIAVREPDALTRDSCICYGVSRQWNSSRDLRIGGMRWETDLQTLKQATEDDCPDCGLILDAVLTMLSIRPELKLPIIHISADSWERLLSISFVDYGVKLEVMRYSGTFLRGVSFDSIQNNVK